MAGTRNYDFLVSITFGSATITLTRKNVVDQIIVDWGLRRGQIVLSPAI